MHVTRRRLKYLFEVVQRFLLEYRGLPKHASDSKWNVLETLNGIGFATTIFFSRSEGPNGFELGATNGVKRVKGIGKWLRCFGWSLISKHTFLIPF